MSSDRLKSKPQSFFDELTKLLTFKRLLSSLLFGLSLLGSRSFANLLSTPNIPISHCYHWLDERSKRFLTFKYKYASQNKGELTFFTDPSTSNGAVAGPGLYCAKTPITSLSYGDRVIRIDFTEDVVISRQDQTKKCGYDGNFFPQAECDRKSVDLLLYYPSPQYDWYVIKNPQSVKSWTENDDQLVKDLLASKAESNSTVQAHFDQTLLAMAAEAQALGKKTYLNLNARASIEDILKDPKQVAKFPTLSLISMIVVSAKLTTAEKNQYVSHFLSKALEDSLLTFSDYESFLKTDSAYVDILKKKVVQLARDQKEKKNAPLLLAFTEKLALDLEVGVLRQLWDLALNGSSSLESVTSLNISSSGRIANALRTQLSTDEFSIKSLATHNLQPFLNLLDQTIERKNSTTENLVRETFSRLLNEKFQFDLIEFLKSLKNSNLDKESNLFFVFNSLSQQNFQGMDPIQMGLIVDLFKDKISASQLQAAQKSLLTLPIKVSTRLTYSLVEDYKNGRLKLPSFFDLDWFLEKSIERSVSERSLGKSTTNTYRMILSGFYSLGTDLIGKEKADTTARDRVRTQFADSLYRLAKKLLNGSNKEYAYIAFQNAILFKHNLKYQIHPLENALEPSGLNELSSFIALSYDPSVLHFLLEMGKAESTRISESRKLLKSYLKTLETTWSLESLGEKADNTFDQEKQQWANVIANTRYTKTARAYSDACSLSKALKEFEKELEIQIGTLSTQLKNQAREIESAYCTVGKP